MLSCRPSSIVGEELTTHTSFYRTIIYHSSTSIYCKLMNRWLCTISNPHMFTKNKSHTMTPSQKPSETNFNIILTTLAFSDIFHKFWIICSFFLTNYMIHQSSMRSLNHLNSPKTKAQNVKSLTEHVTKPCSKTYLGMIKNVNKNV
jgi:hypothetical protein